MIAWILDHFILKSTAFNHLMLKKMVTLEAKTSIHQANVHRREHELSFPLTILEILVNIVT